VQVGIHAQQGQHGQQQRQRLGHLAQQTEQAGGQGQEPEHGIAGRIARNAPPAAGHLGHDVVPAAGTVLCLGLLRAQALRPGIDTRQGVRGDAALCHAVDCSPSPGLAQRRPP